MPAPTRSNPSTVAAPVGAYSHLAKIAAGSDIFYIAGQVGMRPDGVVPMGIAEQADQAYANIVHILASEGLTPAHLVKLNIFAVDGNDVAAVRAARAKHLGEVHPASTFVFVPKLVDPKFQIEIEAVACR